MCASVSQNNEGHSYITHVNTAIGLSPGVSGKKRGLHMDRSDKRRQLRETTIHCKRRCLILKADRNSKEGASTTREGDTYASNIGQERKTPDISEIPSAANYLPVTGDITYVTFDLETGGLSRTSDVIQISAIQGNLEFNKYITPTKPISKEASEVTKLTVKNGELHYDGIAVETLNCEEALGQFITFLQNIDKPVLVGHNIRTFDLLLLHHHMMKFSLWDQFLDKVCGFVDTLNVFKKEYPKRSSCNQSSLITDFMNETYAAHNALEDVKALQRLSQIVISKFPVYTFGADAILRSVNTSAYKLTLQPLVTGDFITNTMANKIAKSGLNYTHLRMAFDRNGYDGLLSVLGEKVNGVVRVTKQGRIIQKIFEHFSQGCN